MTRRTTLIAAVLGAVFIAGLATGMLVDRLMPRGEPVIRARLSVTDMSGVLDRLELTPAQRRQADSIVSRRAPASDAVMRELAEKLGTVADSVDRDLRRILTPAQRARLDSLGAREPRFMLRRKRVTPAGTRVDTVLVGDSTNRRE